MGFFIWSLLSFISFWMAKFVANQTLNYRTLTSWKIKTVLFVWNLSLLILLQNWLMAMTAPFQNILPLATYIFWQFNQLANFIALQNFKICFYSPVLVRRGQSSWSWFWQLIIDKITLKSTSIFELDHWLAFGSARLIYLPGHFRPVGELLVSL